MNFKIANTTKFKMSLLSITLILNYCASIYLALSNNIFAGFLKYSTLAMSILTAILYVFFNRKKRKILLWILIYLVLFIAYRVSKRREVLDLFTIVSFYLNEDFTIINKRVLKVSIFFTFSVVLLNFTHIIPTAPAFYRGEMIRYTLGFIHPNSVGHFAIIIAECLFLRDYKRKKRETLIWLSVLAIVPYIISNCRTAFLIIIALTFSYLINVLGVNVIKKILQLKIMKILLPLLAIGLAFLLWYISNNWSSFQLLNNLLGSRIENNFLFLQKYQVRLFGNAEVPAWIPVYDNWGVRYLDSGYMQSILCLGIINSIMYIYIFAQAIAGNIRARNIEVIIVLIIIAFMLLVEASPLRWYFSIALLYQVNRGKKKELFG